MDWKDVAETVGKVAPTLGGMFAGPAGAGAGALLARALGVEETPEAVSKAVQADPQAALKVREVEASITQALIQQRGGVVQAEASGESWLQRNWRPMVMLWFAGLVGGYWFGFTPDNLSDATVGALFDIVQYGLSGYIVGRSAEKITRTVSGTGIFEHLKKR